MLGGIAHLEKVMCQGMIASKKAASNPNLLLLNS